MAEFLIVTTSFPDPTGARTMLQTLLEKRLVACGHIHEMSSSYWWQGSIQHEKEWHLSLKTRASLYAQLEYAIKGAHPYGVPMIVATPIIGVLPAYAEWLLTETSSSAV